MIGRDYLVRQAMILMRMSRTVHDPTISGPLAAKAADLTERLEETPAAQEPDTPTPEPSRFTDET